MITAAISIVSVFVVVTTAFVLYYQNEQLKKDTSTKMQGIVDQINDSQYYEYKFDKKQEQNIKNLDENVTNVHTDLVKLQNNVKFLEKNTPLKEDLQKKIQTDLLDVNTMKTKRMTVANSTNANNIVFEGGRTTDGNNEGWSAINFNGYYDNGEKRINPNKGRWRLFSEQRGGGDALSIDQWNKNNNWWNYIWMSDGTVGLNNNKLRFSNGWTGFPDNATDQSEISNDVGGFKKLMIVGNKSSGENIRKVGIWDRLDVHGNQGVDGWTSAQNVQGRDNVMTGNWAAWMRKDGNVHVGNNLNVQNKIFFKDPSFSTSAKNENNTDPYYLEKVTPAGNNSHLRLTINDDADESFQIWGDSCRTTGCEGPGVLRHKFGADGSTYHNGVMYVDAIKAHPATYNQRLPNGWGGGVQTLDLYANATIAAGADGDVASYINRNGTVYGRDWMRSDTGYYIQNGSAWMRNDGYTKVNYLQLGDKWRMSGVGDAHGNDGWLRLFGKDGGGYWGGLAAGDLWTARGSLAGSDARMKKDINDLSTQEKAKVTDLEPKKYIYKDDEKQRVHYGFVAQDVEKLYPNLVEQGANGMKSLRYQDFIPLIVSKLKDVEKTVPNDKQVCIDGVCLTKEDILKLKSL